MHEPTHADIENLIRKIILPFYGIKRDTLLPTTERRWENDAEHSWSVSFLACALAPMIDPNLNIGKVAQLATVHDVVEVYADDTSTFAGQDKLASKVRREKEALQRILNEFARFPWIIRNIQEYERKDTDEAKFVSAVDKYITVLYDYVDKGRQLREQKITIHAYRKGLETQRKKVHLHPGVAKYYEEVRALLDSHPEFFHSES